MPEICHTRQAIFFFIKQILRRCLQDDWMYIVQYSIVLKAVQYLFGQSIMQILMRMSLHCEMCDAMQRSSATGTRSRWRGALCTCSTCDCSRTPTRRSSRAFSSSTRHSCTRTQRDSIRPARTKTAHPYTPPMSTPPFHSNFRYSHSTRNTPDRVTSTFSRVDLTLYSWPQPT